MSFDIDFLKSNEKFKLRAGAIIIKNNHVLMIKNDADDYLYSVGGAVRFGETIEQACVREVAEEIGYEYKIEKLAFIHQNFFEEKGEIVHEVSFYFIMKQEGIESFSDSVDSQTGLHEKAVWINIDEFKKYKAFPIFFSEKLKKIPDKPLIITSYE